jgi:hypothetical protein
MGLEKSVEIVQKLRRNILKKSFTTIVAAGLLATIPLASMTHEAEASSKWVKRGLATGVGVGIGLGIANALTPRREVIVQQAPVYVQPAPVYVQPAPVYQGGQFSQAHYNYCFSRFRSYDAPSNSYQPFNGPRKACYSGR